MRIAVAGKGGSGKTTLSATLARTFAREGRTVLAIDGDPNPNLGVALGVPEDVLRDPPRVPRDCVIHETGPRGTQLMRLTRPLQELRAEYAIKAPDGVELMLVATVDHAGQG